MSGYSLTEPASRLRQGAYVSTGRRDQRRLVLFRASVTVRIIEPAPDITAGQNAASSSGAAPSRVNHSIGMNSTA